MDRQIIALLCADGRMSLADIARETGLSTSALHQRVRRLEQRGLITGYRADLAVFGPDFGCRATLVGGAWAHGGPLAAATEANR